MNEPCLAILALGLLSGPVAYATPILNASDPALLGATLETFRE